MPHKPGQVTRDYEKMKPDPFTIERTLHASPEKIWKAITDPALMKQWYFDLPFFTPAVGYSFEFEGGPPERTYLHACIVTEVIPGKKLTYSWRYVGFEGNSLVTFELFPEGPMTRIKLTHEGLESFPKIADLARENFVSGWTGFIGTNLKVFVE